MNEIFFIGDTHFGHKNILVYEKEHRPFACIEEHDEELIKRWNNTVSKKDTVWHLGDFCFGRKNIDIAGRVNGDKRLILGNHDMYPVTEYAKYFTRIYGVFAYKAFILSHVPLHPSNRWEMNIHGHLHSKNINEHGYFNVSCEQINLTPINFEVIKERYKRDTKMKISNKDRVEDVINSQPEEHQDAIKEIISILSTDGFFNKPMPSGTHYRVALTLNDVHFGCCIFTDEKSRDEFLNNYNKLVEITGKKWGFAIMDCEKEKHDE